MKAAHRKAGIRLTLARASDPGSYRIGFIIMQQHAEPMLVNERIVYYLLFLFYFVDIKMSMEVHGY